MLFELWCWRRLLRIPWTARRSNQSILKEISPECSLEGLMLKLKLQSFGHLIWRTDSLEKTLILGKIEGGRRRGWQKMRWLDGITQWAWVWVNSGSWWWTGRPGMLQSMGSQRVRHDWAIELNWMILYVAEEIYKDINMQVNFIIQVAFIHTILTWIQGMLLCLFSFLYSLAISFIVLSFFLAENT